MHDVAQDLEHIIDELICDGTDLFYVGNQGEFDRLALGILRKKKKQYPDIRYYVVLAYMPHDTAEGFDYAETLLPEGQELVYPKYAILSRNRWMVLNSDLVVAYVIHNWGGAAKAVALAEKKGKKIIRLI